jgi:hypothetical protein
MGPMESARAGDLDVSTINARKHHRQAPLAGADGDSGAPTINVKKCRRRPSWPPWGFRSPSGIRKERCDLHRHDRQKIILLMGLILPALSFVMADDPYWFMGHG